MIFLNEYGRLSDNIIYAGAAPGKIIFLIYKGFHINYLVELFPKKTWHLVDPSPIRVKPNERIKIYTEYFNEEFA